jgi:hypothetical protein
MCPHQCYFNLNSDLQYILLVGEEENGDEKEENKIMLIKVCLKRH